ncbi:MAG: alkylhydroperoxidase [Rhodospirillaceae bacterium]|nr:alkylhydroperoxidase [Rhodospirillaceae bacterium]|tara:strand:+ start:70 stop:708 length:639 start_codon:yes stop_codon:yes gene_type:complete
MAKKKRETPDQLQHISKLPIPDAANLPEDLQKYMHVCQEKLGLIPNVIRAFSLRPEKLRTFIGKYNELMLGEDALLTRLEREMIAVVVSSQNHCVYCITSHSQAVRELSEDPVLGDILMVNYREANLTERQRAILDYAFKLTANPSVVGDADRQKLMDVGLGSKEIFEVTDTAAYFNYTNRMTHGLGMLPNEEYFGMNRPPDPGLREKKAAE